MYENSTVEQYVKIAFVGLCERATCVPLENTNILQWNIIGLKQVILYPVYPMHLNSFFAGFCFGFKGQYENYYISIVDDMNNSVGSFTINRKPSDVKDEFYSNNENLLVANYGADWCQAFVSLNDANIVIPSPGVYSVVNIIDGQSVVIGSFLCHAYEPISLSQERILAIQSDPAAAKSVAISYRCNMCLDYLTAYVGLKREVEKENSCFIWYQDLPDKFVCKCGNTNYNLSILRQNMHGMLGCRERSFFSDLMPLYEKSSINKILLEFKKIYNENVKEEVLHKYIEHNIILLHQFPALKVISKPPILSNYYADFAIVTPQRELVLIELERPYIQLLKKDGGISAQLNHAIDQVRDWIHVASDHRLALLDSLKIEREKVSTIRGVVIAGRDFGNDAMHLRKLKGIDFGDVKFLTYDDLYYALDALMQRF